MKNITFINAGAGSGKTYRLTTDLAERLTTTSLQPSQVILTTFTEAAANEFKAKARNQILQAKGVDEAHRVAQATQLDNAFIGTVHAISYRFIQKYWYLLDYGADIKTISNENQDFYLSQSISQLANSDDLKVFRQMRDTFNLEISTNKPDELFWLRDLKAIVEKMDYYNITDLRESIEKSKQTVRSIFTGPSIDSITNDKSLHSFMERLKQHCDNEVANKIQNGKKVGDTTIKRLDCANKYLNGHDFNFNYLCKLDEVLHDLSDKNNILKEIGPLETTSISPNSVDFATIIEQYIEHIFALANRWQDQLSQYKKKQHVISFNDMEKIFLTMLTDETRFSEVQQEIAQNVKLLMVDEFQDSNPIQLKIFNRISELIAPQGGESVWVGDPKQAIYAFRGSDAAFVAEILKSFTFSTDGTPLKEEFEGYYLATDQLKESWRSRPQLVGLSNQVFTPLFGAEGMNESLVTLQPHYPSDADSLGSTPAIYHWETDGSNKETYTKAMAAKIKQILNSGLQVHHKKVNEAADPIAYRDIAILCRTNDDCTEVAKALRQQGLPVSSEENALLQCAEVHLVQTLLRYLKEPSNKLIRANLAILLDNQTTEEVLNSRLAYLEENKDIIANDYAADQWLDNTDLQTSLATLIPRLRTLSVSDIIVALIEELQLGQQVAKWGYSEQRRRNLSTLIAMAQSYDEMCLQMGQGSSIEGFLRYMDIYTPDNSYDNSGNNIKVLTYHRSKGLEWPVVILYSLWKSSLADSDLVKKSFMGVNQCLSDNDAGHLFDHQYYLHFFPRYIKSRSTVHASLMTNIQPIALFETLKIQNLNEAKRLLYVGVTRAKDYLITFRGKSNEEFKWLDEIGINTTSEAVPWGVNANIETENLPLETDQQTAAETYIPVPQLVPQPVENPPLYLSPSRIESFSGYTHHQTLISRPQRGFKVSHVDNIVGTCIHDIFAIYNPDQPDRSLQQAQQLIAQYDVPLQGAESDIIESIAWLYGELTQRYGSAIRTEHELPIEYQLPTGQYLRGEIDLLWFFQHEGREQCVLIDYKSFPGSREQADQHTKQYYPQLSAYRAALQGAHIDVVDALVYYPVIGQVMQLLEQ